MTGRHGVQDDGDGGWRAKYVPARYQNDERKMKMAKKRAIIGFKGLALAPITTDTIVGYQAEAAEPLPYAGAMSRTPKESTQDLYYDDDLYAQIKDVAGDDVEIRLAEMSLQDIAKYGLGTAVKSGFMTAAQVTQLSQVSGNVTEIAQLKTRAANLESEVAALKSTQASHTAQLSGLTAASAPAFKGMTLTAALNMGGNDINNAVFK